MKKQKRGLQMIQIRNRLLYSFFWAWQKGRKDRKVKKSQETEMTRKTKVDGPVCRFCNVQFKPADTNSCIETGVMKADCIWAQPLPPAGCPQSEPLTARQLQAWQTLSWAHAAEHRESRKTNYCGLISKYGQLFDMDSL
jgi:hypothetical protein